VNIRAELELEIALLKYNGTVCLTKIKFVQPSSDFDLALTLSEGLSKHDD